MLDVELFALVVTLLAGYLVGLAHGYQLCRTATAERVRESFALGYQVGRAECL